MTQAKLAQAFVPSDPGEKARKLEEENKLLISQLLQVQEELGRYFKLYKELEVGGAHGPSLIGLITPTPLPAKAGLACSQADCTLCSSWGFSGGLQDVWI